MSTIPSDVDLLLVGATALTGDPDCPLVEDSVIAIRGGRVALLGARADVPQLPRSPRVINLAGRVVTPGFINVHTHAALSVVRGVAEDLGFAPAYTRGIPSGGDIRPDEARALARLGALEALLFGSTLINDSFVHAGATVGAMSELGLRVFVSERVHDVDFSGVVEGRWEHKTEIGERTLGAALDLAERWHGGAQGRVSVQITAHAPDTCSDALLRLIREASLEYGLAVNTHLAQSEIEVERVRARSNLTPAESLDEAGLLDHRLIAAHCIHLEASDIARVGRAGCTVAHVPKGNAIGGALAPTHRLREAGARIALATDNMHGDMIEVMRWGLAVGRLQQRRVSDEWQPRHVFDMATIEGARALGMADEIGSLRVGKKADLVALDFRRPHLTPCLNPLGNLVHTAQGSDVELVIVDGQIVVEGKKAVLVDEEEIRVEGERAARTVWARVKK